jgi:hypothetical protein
MGQPNQRICTQSAVVPIRRHLHSHSTLPDAASSFVDWLWMWRGWGKPGASLFSDSEGGRPSESESANDLEVVERAIGVR